MAERCSCAMYSTLSILLSQAWILVLGAAELPNYDPVVRWTVTDGSGTPCILATFDMVVVVKHAMDMGNPLGVQEPGKRFDSTNSSMATSGFCNNLDGNQQLFHLSLPSKEAKLSLNMTFTKKNLKLKNTTVVSVTEMSVMMKTLKKHTVPVWFTSSASNLSLFMTPLNQSYLCNAESIVSLPGLPYVTTVVFKKLRIQAFTSKVTFDEATVCQMDFTLYKRETSIVIPMIVGASLLLVVVAIITVYATRKFFKQTQYHAMD